MRPAILVIALHLEVVGLGEGEKVLA